MARLVLRLRCSLLWRHPERTFLHHVGGGATMRMRGCPCGKRTTVVKRTGLKYPLPAERLQVVD